MSRLTITLPDELHQALREAAARRGIGLGELIAESLELYGVKPRETAEALVARARENSALDEAAALELALDETRRVRSK
ncbi:MAG TPA: ribbon-helix-helix protein, CopG family [Thermoanaerobaculia bacterium]|nr:ribbon-helix-helix protein, CopG family [Thermoanaerobaculia bacterium]